jgi:hypothetical protein
MTQVEGILGSTWIIGYALFTYFMGICGLYVMLVSFFSALFFGEWLTKYTEAWSDCYTFIYDYY